MLGGLPVEVSWRLVFFVNVPIGIMLLAASMRLLPADPPRRPGSLDIPGAVSVTAGVALLGLAVVRGPLTMQRHDLRHATGTSAADWRSAAACQSADPDLFFPARDTIQSLLRAAEAKAICAGCPVRREGETFVRTGQGHGIWSGRTERERYVPSAEWN